MTPDADRLLAVALKKVRLRDGFSPTELGAKVGMNPLQSDTAARVLANAGVLVLGFDRSAEFSRDFRKSRKAMSPPKSENSRQMPRASGRPRKSVSHDSAIEGAQ